MLRLAEQVTNGRLTRSGADVLVRTVAEAKRAAFLLGCQDIMAFATSAIRDASNSADVLERIHRETGVTLSVLSGEDEARYTFLAVRRWYGWSAGRLLSLDIGGGSLELAAGVDEDPEVAISLPLGAGRLSREWLPDDPPKKSDVARLRDWLDEQLAPAVKRLDKVGMPDRVVATSKTFRSLARLAGAAPSSAGLRTRRTLTGTGLQQVIAFISRMSSDDIAGLEGVSAGRAHQLVAGALVAEASMRALGLAELEICPWALREGVILRRLDAELEPHGSTGPNGDLRPETGRTVMDQAP